MPDQISDICQQSWEEVNALKAPLAVEVIADDSGKFCGNARTFPTAKEAVDYGNDLYSRWTLVREFRIVEAK